MLRVPLDSALGTPSKVSLLRIFARTDRPLSGREAERLAHLTHRPAVRALGELSALGILKREQTAGQYLYTLSRENAFAPKLAALFNVEAERVPTLFTRLATFFRKARKQGHEVLGASIFGSAARGDDAPGSDVDLICILRSQRSVHAIRDELLDATADLVPTLGLQLSPTVMSLADLRRRAAAGDSLIQNVMQDERTVYGSSAKDLVGGGHYGKA